MMDKAMELLLTPTRTRLAQHLAALDNIILRDIQSTAGPVDDADNWRKYLARADDLMALLSMDLVAIADTRDPNAARPEDIVNEPPLPGEDAPASVSAPKDETPGACEAVKRKNNWICHRCESLWAFTLNETGFRPSSCVMRGK